MGLCITASMLAEAPTLDPTPVVTICGDGTGATAEAVLTNGVITAINVTNGGSGYTFAEVRISGTGTGGLATATISTGAVASIAVDAGGSGYSEAILTLSDVQSLTIDETGDEQVFSSIFTESIDLISMDRLRASIVVNQLSFPQTVRVGDPYAVIAKLRPKSRGKGETGDDVTLTWSNAVVTSVGGGPVIEGQPSYNINLTALPRA